MNKRVVLAVFLAIFLSSSMFGILFIIPVKSHPADIIVPDDYEKIQWAIGNASDGDIIFVRAGTYYEHVVVNKTVSLVGENRFTTIIDGNKTGNVVRVVTDDVSLRNFTIRNSGPPPPSPWWARGYSGIYLGGHSHNIIRDNLITDCYGDIEIVMSHNNTIGNNDLSENSNFGIRLHNSTGNIINNNRIADASTGIFLDFGADRNKVNNNTISNTGFGIDINFNCVNNTLKDNTISKCTFGISSYPCYNNIVTGNVISNCSSGISLRGSRNIISGNNISYCEYGGVDIALSNFTVVSGNLLRYNGMGVWVHKSDYNIIFGNILISNGHGFDVRYCTSNAFYHNNVVNNTIQAYLVDTINEWDNGYPYGGNYWSDYTGLDEFSGPYQNETGSDGIGDTQYIIDENNIDRYPLMSPWGLPPPEITATLDIDPDTLNLKSKGKWITCYIELPEGYNVSDIDRTTMLLNGTIPVDPFWVDKPLESVIGDYDDDGIPDLMFKFNRKAVSELILSKGIMHGNATLTITGELFDETLFEGSDVIKVRIPGDENCDGCVNIYDLVIPEFPLSTMPLIFMILSLITVVFKLKKKKQ